MAIAIVDRLRSAVPELFIPHPGIQNGALTAWQASQSRSRTVIAAAAVMLVTFAWRLLSFNGLSNDDYLHLALAQQVRLGEWPVRDFIDPGMPLMYLVSAALQALAGTAIVIEVALGVTGLAVGAALTLLAVTSLTGSTSAGVLAAVLEIALLPRLSSYPKILLTAAVAAAMIAAARSPSRARLATLGGLVSVTFLFRHDYGVYVGLASTVFFVLLHYGASRRVAVRHAAAVAAGAIPLVVPWMCYVEYYQGLVSYVRAGIEMSRVKAQQGGLVLATIDWAPTSGLAGLFSVPNSEAWLFYVFLAAPCVAVVAAWRMNRARSERWAGEAVAVMSLATLALVMDGGLLSENVKYVKLPETAVPIAVLGAWMFVRVWSSSARRRSLDVWSRRSAALLLVAVAAGASLGLGEAYDQLDRAGAFAGLQGIRARVRELPAQLFREHAEGITSSATAGALRAHFGYFDRCTSPTDRILITGFGPDVLVMIKRGFAGRHPPFNPVYFTSDAEQTATVARLQQQSVPLVLVPAETSEEFAQAYPIVQSYLDGKYVRIGEAGVRPARVLADTSRPAAGVDEASGWPCFRHSRDRSASDHERGIVDSPGRAWIAADARITRRPAAPGR